MRIRYIVDQTHPNGAHEIDGQIYSDRKANKFIQWLAAQCSQLKQENELLENENKMLLARLKKADGVR